MASALVVIGACEIPRHVHTLESHIAITQNRYRIHVWHRTQVLWIVSLTTTDSKFCFLKSQSHIVPCERDLTSTQQIECDVKTQSHSQKIVPCKRGFMKKKIPCLFASYFCLHPHPPEIKTFEVKFTEVKTLRFSQRKSKYKRQAWRHREFRGILNKRYQFKRYVDNLHIFGISLWPNIHWKLNVRFIRTVCTPRIRWSCEGLTSVTQQIHWM